MAIVESMGVCRAGRVTIVQVQRLCGAVRPAAITVGCLDCGQAANVPSLAAHYRRRTRANIQGADWRPGALPQHLDTTLVGPNSAIHQPYCAAMARRLCKGRKDGSGSAVPIGLVSPGTSMLHQTLNMQAVPAFTEPCDMQQCIKCS
jgi:hypothetical protein